MIRVLAVLALALPVAARGQMLLEGDPYSSSGVPETVERDEPVWPAAEVDPSVRAEAEAARAAFCASPLPVLVLDNFEPRAAKSVDVDGDGVLDLGHGDLIAALYRSRGREVIEQGLPDYTRAAQLAPVLDSIAASVEAGELKISAVSFSQTLDVRWAGLPGRLTPADAGERRAWLAAELIAAMKEHDPEDGVDIEPLFKAAARLKAAGVPILGIAGNQGPNRINILNLLPGAVSVGALGRDGAVAAFSARHSLVGLWARGEHVVRLAPGGADLNGDGRPDVPSSRLSGGTAAAARFSGRTVEDVVSEALPDDPVLPMYSRETRGGIDALTRLLSPDKVYRLAFLAAYFKLPARRVAILAARGTHFTRDLRTGFVVRGGRVVFDPEDSGAPNQVRLVSGTSFTQPFLCPSR